MTHAALLTPSFAEFEAGWQRGENQMVHARLAADLDTPVSLYLKLVGTRRDSFMLESVTGGEVRGRYSIIGTKPDLIWHCARCWPKAGSPCPPICPPPRPGCSAIWPMT